MALAHVNIADVSKFKESISNAKDVFFNTQDKFYNTLDIATGKVNEGIREAKELIERCQKSIQALERKIESLQEVLAGLQASLAATPPTITETTQDEEGNIKTEEYPNPRYQELQSEISSCEAKISAVKSQQEQFKLLQQSINAAKERLDQAIQSFQTSLDAVSDQYERLNSVSEEAVNKLTKIEEILHKYLEEKLTPPKVSIPSFHGGGSVAGSLGGLSKGGILKTKSSQLPLGYGNVLNKSLSDKFTAANQKNNNFSFGKARCLQKTEQKWQEWAAGDKAYDSPFETGKLLVSKQGSVLEYSQDCGIVASLNVARMAGLKIDEPTAVKLARQYKLCNVAREGCPGGGTNPEQRKELLSKMGIESTLERASIDTIAQNVSDGRGVIISVKTGELYGSNKNGLHAIVVTSVVKNSKGDINGFIVCDSNGDSSMFYSSDDIENALTPNRPMNVTKNIIR